MKKIIMVFLTLVMTFSIAGCKDEKNVSNESPEITDILATSNEVKISWKDTEGDNKYNIYRSSDFEESKVIATVSSKDQFYIDTDVRLDTAYTYKIENTSSKQVTDEYDVTPMILDKPKLLYIESKPLNGVETSRISWESEEGSSYRIMRKNGDSPFVEIGSINAKDDVTTYTDKSIEPDIDYIYTVEKIEKLNKIVSLTSGNNSEIQMISKKPSVDVDFTNLHASINWEKLDEIDGYEILRKTSSDKKFEILASVDADQTNFEDIYHDTFKGKDKKSLAAKYFLDPSVNGVSYTVRGFKQDGEKKIYTNYCEKGDFYLETPAIVSVDIVEDSVVKMEWSTVKNAEMYYLYSGYMDENNNLHWRLIETVDAEKNVRQVAKAKFDNKHTYFTVKASANKNGKEIFSDFDKGFNIENRKFKNSNILFFGDSITFGSPYKGKNTRDVFSYPYRVHQLTEAQFYNPSIPGSTYTYKEKSNRSRMINIADCLNEQRNVTINDLTKKTDDYVYQTSFVNNQINGKTFSDFDVIIFAAGTNDYLDDALFGDLNSTNIYEMNGSLNKIMSYVKEANKKRSYEGKSPIKLVFIDLFYSDRTYDYSQKTNRFITQNKLGLTLKDYQDNIDNLVNKYKNEGFDIYQFNTNDLINEGNCPYVTSDNLHMTRYTYTQIGNSLTNFLIENNILQK